MDDHPEVPEGTEEFGELIRQVAEDMEEIGLYVLNAAVQSSVTPDQLEEGQTPRDLIEQGEQFVLRILFRVGSLAWSDRVLRPEEFAASQEFQRAAPTEEEIALETILSEGHKLFDLGDDEQE